MTNVESAFLQLLKTAISGDPAEDLELDPADWETLFSLAKRQKVLPLILHSAAGLPSYRKACSLQTPAPKPDGKALLDLAFQEIYRQVFQENDLLNLLLSLRQEGLDPVMVKGVVLRQLYPIPVLRPSVDEDMLIAPGEARAMHSALIERGVEPDEPGVDPASVVECSYHKPNTPTYLEVHQALFDPASPAYGDFELMFNGCIGRSVTMTVQDVTIRTLCPTDHLLFLILHAFKHFVHSGFGLRIAADICLFAQKNADELEMDAVYSDCRDLRCHRFASAIFRIGERYLGIPAPEPFASAQCEIAPLLTDMFDAGLHGQDIDRLHSANITLGMIADDRKGITAARSGLRASLFPPAEALKSRYSYLNKHSWLLPVAWTQRIGSYIFRSNAERQASHPKESIRIGKERVVLLKQYGIIGKDE